MTLSGIGSLVSVELTSVVWTGLMLGWVETMFCDGVMMVVVGLGPLLCDIENIVEGMASLSLDELTTGVGMGSLSLDGLSRGVGLDGPTGGVGMVLLSLDGVTGGVGTGPLSLDRLTGGDGMGPLPLDEPTGGVGIVFIVQYGTVLNTVLSQSDFQPINIYLYRGPHPLPSTATVYQPTTTPTFSLHWCPNRLF